LNVDVCQLLLKERKLIFVVSGKRKQNKQKVHVIQRIQTRCATSATVGNILEQCAAKEIYYEQLY
jgi:hypothetical protein